MNNEMIITTIILPSYNKDHLKSKGSLVVPSWVPPSCHSFVVKIKESAATQTHPSVHPSIHPSVRPSIRRWILTGSWEVYIPSASVVWSKCFFNYKARYTSLFSLTFLPLLLLPPPPLPPSSTLTALLTLLTLLTPPTALTCVKEIAYHLNWLKKSWMIVKGRSFTALPFWRIVNQQLMKWINLGNWMIWTAVGVVGVEPAQVGHVRHNATRFRRPFADPIARGSTPVSGQHQQSTRQDATHRSRFHRHVRPR